MYADSVHFSSSPALLPPSSPYTSPLRATTPKRRLQRSPGADTPRRFCPFPTFHNSSGLPLRTEYNIEDTTWEPELRVSTRESARNIRRSFHLTQLQRSSLHLEKRLVRQKIEEHEISLQALKERMADIENDIASTTYAVGTLHCYMDQNGIPVPDMAEHVAASIVFSEDEDAGDSQDGDASDSQNGNASDSQDQTLEDAATSETVPLVVTVAPSDYPPSVISDLVCAFYAWGRLDAARQLESNQFKRPIDHVAPSIRNVQVDPHVQPDTPSRRSCLWKGYKRLNGPLQALPHCLEERAQELMSKSE
ncbi:hypothetical protein EDB86DRAFT_3078277 [Lactarius hatsudake]|nr:hypothetical protein EDB86DRAFT_3078277 [Lactarius hatsudake]